MINFCLYNKNLIMDNQKIQNDYLKWKNKRNLKGSKKITKVAAWKISAKKKRQMESELISSLEEEYSNFDSAKVESYEDFPLTDKTKVGLDDCGYVKPTAIQKAAILPALKGNDVLGAAKTGSGKTLAFLVPVLECLYRHQYNSADGPGSLIISPTRELALQTFEVLCKVGRHHDFSAGLVIGGKDVQEEAERVCRTNIVVCTPGRLLQHLDSTSYFTLENLKILVLDEADRILDLGFSATINAILENLPPDRQTLLFSATQTNCVKELARLSLNDPVYVSVHAESKHCTPKGLVQRYVVCPLHEKMNMLFSFVKSHLKAKTLVFVSSCKQVQYLFAAFSQLRPGISIMHLHGNMHLNRRLGVYREFCRKQHVVLIATDIAARGLDFPGISWVVQLDCPEDAETYIHRVGRTARFNGNGNALLVLLPTEVAMIEALAVKKVPIEKSQVNTSKLVKVDSRLQSFCAENQELHEQAKRCFVAYYKAIHTMKNKSIFKIKELPGDEFATSLGLSVPPRVRFLKRLEKRKVKQAKKKESTDSVEVKPKHVGGFGAVDDQGDLFSIKPVSEKELESKIGVVELKIEEKASKRSKRKKAKLATALLRRGHKYNEKVLFDDSGKVYLENGEEVKDDEDGQGLNIDKAKALMKKRDLADRKEQRRKLSEKRLTKKLKEKRKRLKESEEPTAELAGASDEFDDNQSSHDENSDDSDAYNKTEISDEEIEPTEVAPKRRKMSSKNAASKHVNIQDSVQMTLEDHENLVLKLIGK